LVKEIGQAELASSTLNDFSLVDEAKAFNKADIPTDSRSLTELLEEDLIGAKGRYVNIGASKGIESMGGSNKIYIPGREDSPELMRSTTSKGNIISSPIETELKNLRSAVLSGNQEYMESAGASLRNVAVKSLQDQSIASGRIAG
jgi:hypothetical protein